MNLNKDCPEKIVHVDSFLSIRFESEVPPQSTIERVNRMFSMGHFFEGWHQSPEDIVALIKEACKEASCLHWLSSHESGSFEGSRPGNTDDFMSISLTQLSRFNSWLWGFVNTHNEGCEVFKKMIAKVTKVIALLQAERTGKIESSSTRLTKNL